MTINSSFIKETKKLYRKIKPQIESRLREFESVWKNGSEKDIFAELVFCLLTPQSKARSCFAAVSEFTRKDLLLKGNFRELSGRLNCVRFRNNKARYIIAARKQFMQNGSGALRSAIEGPKDPAAAREWFVRNVKGLGYKEASHFLRNISQGKDLVILDRHILKNLKRASVIKEIPRSMNHSKYLEIEKKMRKFSKKIGIPLSHLDFVFWYREAGEVFK